MARVAAGLLRTPGICGVDERPVAGVWESPVLEVRFDPTQLSVAEIASIARHGLEIDPANHLRVTVHLLPSGLDSAAWVRQSLARREAADGLGPS